MSKQKKLLLILAFAGVSLFSAAFLARISKANPQELNQYTIDSYSIWLDYGEKKQMTINLAVANKTVGTVNFNNQDYFKTTIDMIRKADRVDWHPNLNQMRIYKKIEK